MSELEIVLVFVGGPAAILGLLALLTLVPPAVRAPRYRPGQSWDYPPVWWTANPAGARTGGETREQTSSAQPGVVGGARGRW